MPNIKEFIKKIGSETVSLEEQQQALSEIEKTIKEVRQKREEEVGKSAKMVVDALKQIEQRLNDKFQELLATPAMVGAPGKDGKDGKDGKNGLPGPAGINGAPGKDGIDGEDGKDGVSVVDAKIDFDGSLVITLSNGNEIDAGLVIPTAVAEQYNAFMTRGEIIPLQTGNSGKYLTTDGNNLAWDQINISTADITGTLPIANGGTGATTAPTARTNLGLGTIATQDANNVAVTGGAIDGTTIGGSTPAAGTFTTLTATGTSYFGGSATSRNIQVDPVAGGTSQYTLFGRNTVNNAQKITAANTSNLYLQSTGGGAILFNTGDDTPNQFRVTHTASAVNYVQVTGAATSGTPVISAQGSDSNIPIELRSKGTSPVVLANGSGVWIFTATHSGVANRFNVTNSAAGISPTLTAGGSDTNVASTFISKGTGAINLAPGSSGVNISNGGTVTAITRTAAGTNYTSVPSVAITAPTTAGGVQATATVSVGVNTVAVAFGGTGYTLNDTLTIVGGTGTPCVVTATGVSGGVVTAVTYASGGSYTVTPTNPAATSGGTGSGCTINLTYGINNSFTITNAGSGYVEQPTVTFSGGGGSAAAAFASVGSIGKINSLAGTTNAASLEFYSPISSSVPQLAIFNANIGHDTYPAVVSFSANAGIQARGSTNGNMNIGSNGSGAVKLVTNGIAFTEQLRVTHTASAVNYVQVTGNATNNPPSITAAGSDTNIALVFNTKGNGNYVFRNQGGTNAQLRIYGTNAAVNNLAITGTTAGNAPFLSAEGSDTNIDLNLTTKGTGAVRFNTGGGEQARISNTASAVNYVQVTGSATGGSAAVSSAGSDSTVNLAFVAKGSGAHLFFSSGGSARQFEILHTASTANYPQVTGAATGSAPSYRVAGSDTNIDLALTPKGTGLVRFGTRTATSDVAITGYIEIKDSGGTTRKLAIID